MGLPPTLEQIIESFSRFPGIGKKTAQRLSLHVMKTDREFIYQFAKALMDAKDKITYCHQCHNYAEDDLCLICGDNSRDISTICVVEEPSDILLFEKTGYHGMYHVLNGVLSPLDGIGPDDLNIDNLLDRLNDVEEVIIATNTSIEGDTTALYISKLLSEKNIKITRLARGIPVGGHLEFVDDATLSRSISERVSVK
jgi:recombination protein RecR